MIAACTFKSICQDMPQYVTTFVKVYYLEKKKKREKICQEFWQSKNVMAICFLLILIILFIVQNYHNFPYVIVLKVSLFVSRID